jgi:predicted DNA-binding transcriptional regulator YafY
VNDPDQSPMPAMKYINKILRINTLVKLRATGSPRELAYKLGISERSVYEYISNMKELGAPIAFSYSHNSYIYYKDGDLVIGFSHDMLDEEEEQITFGGCAERTKRFNITAEIVQ